MTAAAKEFDDLLTRLVQEKILTLDGLQALSSVKTKLEEAEVKLTRRDDEIKELKADKSRLEARLREVTEDRDARQAREAAVAQREANQHTVDQKAAVAEAKASTWESALRIVFAPNTTRSAVQAFGNSNQNGQYSNTGENRTDQTTEGYHVPTSGEQTSMPLPGHKSSI